MKGNILLKAAALAVSVLPAMITALLYFPFWAERGDEAVISGLAALLMLLAALPIYRLAKRLLASPSVWVMWLFVFILFYSTSKIADEMIVISFVGAVSNAIGAVMFRISRRGRENE
jgi:chromate transport protein ChrA